MWFKQAQLFQLPSTLNYSQKKLIQKLELLIFNSCLPSMPISTGWVSVIDEEEAPLVQSINNHVLICLQVEEKILPPSVVQQTLIDKIKQIENTENRRVNHKEKFALKDEIILTLLPQAFSKFTRIYAYIDTKHHWLVLGTTNKIKTEQFLLIFKRSITDKVHPLEIKKIPPILTRWVKEKSYPSSLTIEESCVLQDPNYKHRVIRCQHQDLFARAIQSLIKDGYEITQLALLWQGQISFVLADDFSLKTIQFQDELQEQAKEMEPDTAQLQLEANFMIMSTALSSLFKKLLSLLLKSSKR